MAKIIQTLCDYCLEQDENSTEPGHSVGPIAIGTDPPMLLDACDTHEKEHIEPLRETLRRLGQAVAPQPRIQQRAQRGGPPQRNEDGSIKPEDVESSCYICGQRVKRKSLGSHYLFVHPEHDLATLRFEHGDAELLLICTCKSGFNSRAGFSTHKTRTSEPGPHSLAEEKHA